ncbi:MAG TPA: tRNA (adenosine(37)-N6)-threonylcarbamoyltransferase complex transferase subunit TsaD, partial [Anaerolineae bacterium]|nr:tRNA (adenosine(37)-N6)-threonylcarbamoyltransferase complex transferase subunit TsaD [Anaerolineae bacterium]
YLCTDNAAMIAAAGTYAWRTGRRGGWDLDVAPSAGLTSLEPP